MLIPVASDAILNGALLLHFGEIGIAARLDLDKVVGLLARMFGGLLSSRPRRIVDQPVT